MIAATVLCAALAAAEIATPPEAELSYRVWTVDDGLAQGSVFALEQTPDGYLWIATLDGLVRFDGASLRRFSRSDHPGLGSNRILALHVDREGSLWIGTEDGGAARMKDGGFRRFGAAEGLAESFVSAFEEDAEGRLWATTSAGLQRFDGDRWSVPEEGRPREGESAIPFVVGRTRTGEALRLLERKGSFVDYPWPRGTDPRNVALGRDPRGGVWLRTADRSFLEFRGGAVTSFEIPHGLRAGDLPRRFAATRGAGDRVWILANGRLQRFERGTWHTYAIPVPEAAASPLVLFEDREGSVWIGGEAGLAQAVPTPIRTVTPGGDPVASSFYPVAESADGRLWAGSRSWAYRLEGDRFVRLDALREAFVLVTAFEPEPDGSMLVATPGRGVIRVTPDLRVAPVFATDAAIEDLLRDRAGRLWMATGRGVLRADGAEVTRFGREQGLAGDDAEVLLEGADGAIWVGGRAGLSRIDGDRAAGWTTASGLPSDRIRALHEDERGSLWIGTYDGGLVRLRDGKFAAIRARDGLHDDGVFAIVDDGMGRFWMSSNRGLHVAERSELDAFADGTARSVASWSFGRDDGMLSIECNGGMQPSGIRRRDGTLVFPTQKGLVIVDPRAFRPNPIVPHVAIEEIASEHRAHAVAPEVVLEPNESRLEVRFTATTFVRPGQARFRYRLEGLDDEWAEAGTARFARYSYVPPGDYVFRVVASNGDGVWNETGASFALAVRPAWWQTAWLRAGVALVLVAGIVAGFRVRVSRLKRRRAEQDRFARQLIGSQEAERKRIAAELHDGIGQTLAIIRNRALLGLRDGPISGRAQRQVEQIAEVATGAIDEIRKVTHNLRPYQIDRLGLARAIEALVEQAAAATEIEFDSAIDPLDGVFAPEDGMNVYRIVQEAVGNLVRHAGAKRARVAVHVRPTEVEIVVADDGRGFDPDALPPERGGMGLSGIAERVRILGGRRTIRSEAGRGTRVTVRLPRTGARG